MAALKRLAARAPELAPQLVSQVNGCLSFGAGKVKYMPRPVLLQATSQSFAGMASFREFYFNDCGIEDSVARSELAGDLPPDVLAPFAEITYIPVHTGRRRRSGVQPVRGAAHPRGAAHARAACCCSARRWPPARKIPSPGC